ncbi:hypothetical protein [Muribaculum sp.]|jgi:hypothetical protein|uniref:hypothetical protein n=1 Tax=Muribaculum sp. TaxID=1918611 RepID=UPI00257A1597|nr:hypothetical protein [Muribaculum sp.]
MSYIPSVNIEMNTASDFRYIVTENAKLVAGNIVNSFNSGHHSFSIIGTYGTGKSSFILALEDDLANGNNKLVKKGVLGSVKGFDFLNIVGDYAPLGRLLSHKIGTLDENPINALNTYYQSIRKQNKFLVIVVDEFGKILEHAANNNPEKELYFLQKLSEFVNVPSRSIILLTTLHQNFGSYAAKLTETQRNEWHKVKGRFQEIVFVEPVEQLLSLTAKRLNTQCQLSKGEELSLSLLYDLGVRSKIVSRNLGYKTAESLYPLDTISAVCLTLAIQKYGQNERSLFSFLSAKGVGSINDFKSTPSATYNVAMVYDYLTYHFYSAITETNADSMGWRSLSVAIERIEGSNLDGVIIKACLKLTKTIGLINMFFNGIVLDDDFLITYGENALGLTNTQELIKTLISHKIVRFAKYKSQYILFEGTNIDMEEELYKAASIVPTPTLSVEEIAPYISQKAAIASASYYRNGTPRYFEYRITNEPTVIEPTGDIDGFIHLVFPLSDNESEVIAMSASASAGASIYGYFKNTDKIVKHLYEIKKLQYVIDNVAFDDRVAKSEFENQKNYETQKLNDTLNASLTSDSDNIVWYYNGNPQCIKSVRDFNKLLSRVCDEVYFKAPIIRNELFNRQKLSSAISLARVNLLDAMLNHSDEENFGIEAFPPEKTIYFTLFRDSGIHRKDENGNWILGAPTSDKVKTLWDASIKFVNSSVDKQKKLTELVKILKSAPYKLKQGVIDFWIPIFLYINQQDFALYNNGTFVLSINKEVFELMQKRLNDFSLKAFKVSGVKLEFFKRYRQFLRKDDTVGVYADSLTETVKPFFHFYRGLNNYAKITRKFDNAYTAKFRDVLSNAQDPAKTFFEDLPAALGYKDLNSDEFIQQYLDLIRRAVRELNSCYDNLIDRIEEKIVEHLGLPSDYIEYKEILEERYKTIDSHILTPKTRSFLDRILAPSESKREFIEKLAIVINDKRLDETKDSDESMLVHQILHVLSELERYSAIGVSTSNDGSEAFSFELASNKGDFSKSQTYRLPKNKVKEANETASKIESLLTDDDELNICILLKLLNDKIK